jgi:hypothetical protein
MEQENISSIVKVAICICAQDGLVSETEENKVYELIAKRFPNYPQESFKVAVDEFFSSELQIEDYMTKITDPELQKFTFQIAKESATSDGLDIRENIAVVKAVNFWNLSNE